MRLKIVFLGFVIVLSALARESLARTDGSVLVVGKASPRQRVVIVDSVLTTAREGGWAFEAPGFSTQEADAVLGCLRTEQPWLCIAPVLKGKGDKLVVVQVAIEAADTVLTVHVLAAGTDAESTANQFCNACTDDALKQAVAVVSKQALRDSAERSGKTVLAIRSRPDKAWITLDGKPAGATNSMRPTYPGDHTVMLRHSGYVTATRDVKVNEGQTLEVELALEPLPGTPIGPLEHPIDPPSRFVPKLVVGAGAVLILGGAILVAVDEDPSPIGKRHEYYYNTAPQGVGAIIVGAAGVGAGVYLWVRASRASKSKPTSSPTIAPQPGGATVGWSGSF